MRGVINIFTVVFLLLCNNKTFADLEEDEEEYSKEISFVTWNPVNFCSASIFFFEPKKKQGEKFNFSTIEYFLVFMPISYYKFWGTGYFLKVDLFGNELDILNKNTNNHKVSHPLAGLLSATVGINIPICSFFCGQNIIKYCWRLGIGFVVNRFFLCGCDCYWGKCCKECTGGFHDVNKEVKKLEICVTVKGKILRKETDILEQFFDRKGGKDFFGEPYKYSYFWFANCDILLNISLFDLYINDKYFITINWQVGVSPFINKMKENKNKSENKSRSSEENNKKEVTILQLLISGFSLRFGSSKF